MKKKVTVIIPSFSQNQLLKRCLNSLHLQSYKNFDVLIVDDASSNNLDSFIIEFKDLSLEIKYNPQNLGAFNNMLSCIFLPVESDYKIVFHEDDIMHPLLIRTLVDVLENDEKLFAAGTVSEIFRDNYSLQKKDFEEQKLCIEIYRNKADLIYDFLNGTHLCFGSIMYRETTLPLLKKPDVENYWTLADRPFIIDNLNEYSFAIIKNKFVFYNDHYKDDKRASKLTKKNLLNFLYLYKSETKNLALPKKKYVSSIIAKEILECYNRFENKSSVDFLNYIFKAFKIGILSPKYFFYHYFLKR